MRTTAAALAVVVLFALGALGASVLRHPQYTPDGIAYARYAARDAGYGERDATLAARAFYEKTALMRVPRYRALVEIDPSVAFSASHIFENRVLYPALVALLLPVAGFKALFIVSAASYVFFGIALFWMLAAFGRPWLAASLTILALALPLTRELGGSDLTDMLSATWWTLALGALLRLMRTQTPALLLTLAVASVLLTLTRPTPYMILVPALALAFVRGMWLPVAVSCAGVAAFVILAFLSHAYGVGEQLRWVYSHEPQTVRASFGAWYRGALLLTLRYTLVQAVRTIVPIILILASIYGAVRLRVRDEMIVLLAAAAACLIAIAFNPVPSAIARVVVFPLLPVFCAITQCFITALPANTSAAADRLRPAV
jgi:hypothetical protein